MSVQPFEVAAPVDHFVDARLQKEDGKKRGDEDLQEVGRSLPGMQVRHPTTLTPNNCSLSILTTIMEIVKLRESRYRAILGNCRTCLPTWLADFHRKHEPDGLSLRSLQQLRN
jgi:hypothetical protein